MKYLLYSVLAATVTGGTWLGLTHEQTAPEPPASPPHAEDPSPPPPSGNEQEPERNQEDELAPFTPSEKVPADSAISFPVDI